MPLAQVWTCYNVRWTQHMTLFFKVYLYPIFWESNMKGMHLLELNNRLASVNHYKITWTQTINIVPHPKSKSHNTNSIKSKSSKSFHNTKGTSQFLLLELNARHSSVTTSSIEFSFQNLVFVNLFEFSAIEIIFKSISPTFWLQILPHKFH